MGRALGGARPASAIKSIRQVKVLTACLDSEEFEAGTAAESERAAEIRCLAMERRRG